VRIAQRVEQQLDQQFAQEREYWRRHLVDLIAAELVERLVVVIEEECRKLIDRVEADIDRVFDRPEAKLDKCATPGMCPDEDSSPPRSTH
jgi:hypothetical protein